MEVQLDQMIDRNDKVIDNLGVLAVLFQKYRDESK
jgi:hypothetical protein